MSEDTFLPFDFPAVGRKKITAAFDGGRMTSDGAATGVRGMGICEAILPRPQV